MRVSLSTTTGSMSASGGVGQLAGPEPGTRDHHQTAAKLADELAGHLAEPRAERRLGHVAQEDHVFGKELAPLRRQGRQE